MKTAIVYFSKTGSAAECARELYRLLPDSRLVNLAVDKCNISSYDNIILGSGIRYGKISAELKKYISENELEIRKKNIGLYVCCLDKARSSAYIEKNFPPLLVKKAVVSDGFGAKINLDEIKGIEKIIAKSAVKKVVASTGKSPSLDHSAIFEFARRFI